MYACLHRMIGCVHNVGIRYQHISRKPRFYVSLFYPCVGKINARNTGNVSADYTISGFTQKCAQVDVK